MIKILLFLSVIIILVPYNYADTPPPVITFSIVKTITWTSTLLGGNQTLATVTTSWDPSPVTVITCTDPNCRLVIEDCNGSLSQCETETQGRDWNAIPSIAKQEYDLTCINSCTRLGVVEDTAFTTRIDLLRVGSRWLRACWYDTTLINCSAWRKVHTYNDSSTVPAGVSFCRPSQTGDTNIFNNTCVYDQNNNTVPLEFFVQSKLYCTDDCKMTFLGSSLDFNRANNSSSLLARIHRDPTSSTFIRWIYAYGQKFNTYPAFNFDANRIAVIGYSSN